MKELLYYSKHRHATWLELFFDLVFVTLIGRITHLISFSHDGHLEWLDVIRYGMMFIPIWWLWANHTIYSNIYDADTKTHRFVTLIIMLLMIGQSISFVAIDFAVKNIPYILLYSFIKIILSGLYLSSVQKHESNRSYAQMLGRVYLFNALIGLSGLLFDAEICYGIFYLSVLFDLIVPLFRGQKLPHLTIHREHLVERIGLLTIILLGESIISLENSLSQLEWTMNKGIAAVSGFILLGSLWWIIFDFFNLLIESHKITKPYIVVIPSLFMHMGLGMVASVIQHGILNDLSINIFRTMVILSVVLIFIGKQIPYYFALKNIRKYILQNTTIVLLLSVSATLFEETELILATLTVAVLTYVALTFRYMAKL